MILIDFDGMVRKENITKMTFTPDNRAPEHILQLEYGHPIDMWAAG